MIRILHLNTENGWRGGENQTRLLIEGMKNNSNFENHMAALKNSECYEIFRKICPVFPINSSFPYHILQARRIAKYCKANQIQIIDAQSGRTHSLACLIKLFNPSLKIVVHRRVDNIPSKNFFSRRKYLSNSIDGFIAISNAIKEILVQTGVPSNKIYVVKSAVPDFPYLKLSKQNEKNNWAKKLNIDEKKIWIGNASAIANQKAYDVLLKAVQILKQENFSFHCLIAGTGPQEAEIKKLCTDLNLNDMVTFVGFTNEVPSFLSSLDILTVPSNNEGLGTIILEGIHAGCAVIGSEVGGIPEMIIHQKTGLLIPKQSPSHLATSIKELINDESLRKNLVTQAKKHALENFSVEAMVNGNIEVYKKLVQ